MGQHHRQHDTIEMRPPPHLTSTEAAYKTDHGGQQRERETEPMHHAQKQC